MSAPSTPDDSSSDTKCRSTWPQRLWTLAGTAAILSSFLTCARLLLSSPTSPTSPLVAAMAAFAGYSLADLGSGIYHWLIDNYAGPTTPIIGAQVASFLDHRRRPHAITRLEPCNLLHALARAVAVALPPVGAALSARGAPACAHAFCCAFAAFGMLSVQFHAWAHEARADARLPRGVAALQRAGVLVSRARHAGHHRGRHDSCYCSVSGMWNPVLDAGCRAFEKMEKVTCGVTGVRPRSWGEVVVVDDGSSEHVG